MPASVHESLTERLAAVHRPLPDGLVARALRAGPSAGRRDSLSGRLSALRRQAPPGVSARSLSTATSAETAPETAISPRQLRGSRRRVLEPVATVAAAAVVIGLFATFFVLGRTPGSRSTTAPQPIGSIAPASAAQLASGRWSTLPPAPIPPRDGASVVWTGSELLVWGGASFSPGKLHADGAAYNPTTGHWRTLARSPLSGRVGQASVWDGTELLIWGGGIPSSSSVPAVASDGAAYNPATDSWRMLPQAPLSARTDVIATWTGARMLLLGGAPDPGSNTGVSPRDGAAYDPAADQWSSIAPPSPPSGHSLTWSAAVQAGPEVLAWSHWSTSSSCGSGCTSTTSGTDVFAYTEQAGWRVLPLKTDAHYGADEALWTGRDVILRGAEYCGGCLGPARPDDTSRYDPGGNTWTKVPGDPLQWSHPLAAWTGGALFSFNAMANGMGIPVDGIAGVPLNPGDASAYDNASGWIWLPSAPFGCASSPSPVWTGRQVILYCPGPEVGSNTNPGGLALSVGTPSPGQVPSAKGDVVGGIEPCSGTALPPGGPTYAAGTVTVYKGTTLVAEETVPTDIRFHFVLRPGSYVFVAHYSGGTVPNAVVPHIVVNVTAGTTTDVTIPSVCK